MKCVLPIMLCVSLLMGCAGPKTYETMTDFYYAPEPPKPAEVALWLPENATLDVLKDETAGTLYLCDGYTVSVQTMESGDLDATLCAVTGYGKQALHGIGWQRDGISRYECAWASAGEGGDQIGRTVVLDDGDYHYVVTVMGQAELAGAMTDTWQTITDSAALHIAPLHPDTAAGTDQ